MSQKGSSGRRSIYDSGLFKLYVNNLLEGGKYAKYVDKMRTEDPVVKWKRSKSQWHRYAYRFVLFCVIPASGMLLLGQYLKWHMMMESEASVMRQERERQFVEMEPEQFDQHTGQGYSLEWTGSKSNMWKTAYAGIYENVQRMKIWKGMYQDINDRLNTLRQEKQKLDHLEQYLQKVQQQQLHQQTSALQIRQQQPQQQPQVLQCKEWKNLRFYTQKKVMPPKKKIQKLDADNDDDDNEELVG